MNTDLIEYAIVLIIVFVVAVGIPIGVCVGILSYLGYL